MSLHSVKLALKMVVEFSLFICSNTERIIKEDKLIKRNVIMLRFLHINVVGNHKDMVLSVKCFEEFWNYVCWQRVKNILIDDKLVFTRKNPIHFARLFVKITCVKVVVLSWVRHPFPREINVLSSITQLIELSVYLRQSLIYDILACGSHFVFGYSCSSQSIW